MHNLISRIFIFTGMKTLKTFNIHIAVARRIRRFTLFYERLITCTLRILFLLMVIKFIFLLLLNKYEQRAKTVSRVETNFFPGIEKAKLSLGRLN